MCSKMSLEIENHAYRNIKMSLEIENRTDASVRAHVCECGLAHRFCKPTRTRRDAATSGRCATSAAAGGVAGPRASCGVRNCLGHTNARLCICVALLAHVVAQ